MCEATPGRGFFSFDAGIIVPIAPSRALSGWPSITGWITTGAVISGVWLLVIYCTFVLLASLAGGWLPLLVHLTHTRLQMAISLVAGLMLGIALLHFLPDAAEQLQSLDRTVGWVLGGFVAMFFLQRFFHFHHIK